LTVAGTQLLPSVSTGGRDTVVRQVQWSAAVQTPVNYHCHLEEHPIGISESFVCFIGAILIDFLIDADLVFIKIDPFLVSLIQILSYGSSTYA